MRKLLVAARLQSPESRSDSQRKTPWKQHTASECLLGPEQLLRGWPLTSVWKWTSSCINWHKKILVCPSGGNTNVHLQTNSKDNPPLCSFTPNLVIWFPKRVLLISPPAHTNKRLSSPWWQKLKLETGARPRKWPDIQVTHYNCGNVRLCACYFPRMNALLCCLSLVCYLSDKDRDWNYKSPRFKKHLTKSSSSKSAGIIGFWRKANAHSVWVTALPPCVTLQSKTSVNSEPVLKLRLIICSQAGANYPDKHQQVISWRQRGWFVASMSSVSSQKPIDRFNFKTLQTHNSNYSKRVIVPEPAIQHKRQSSSFCSSFNELSLENKTRNVDWIDLIPW